MYVSFILVKGSDLLFYNASSESGIRASLQLSNVSIFDKAMHTLATFSLWCSSRQSTFSLLEDSGLSYSIQYVSMNFSSLALNHSCCSKLGLVENEIYDRMCWNFSDLQVNCPNAFGFRIVFDSNISFSPCENVTLEFLPSGV